MKPTPFVLLAVACAGCSGSNAGGQSGTPDAGARCQESRTAVTPGDPTPFGWSPSTAMALLSAPRTATVRYRDAASDGFVRTPGSASTTIHLRFTFDESRLYFVASSDINTGMISPYCNNHMALGVRPG